MQQCTQLAAGLGQLGDNNSRQVQSPDYCLAATSKTRRYDYCRGAEATGPTPPALGGDVNMAATEGGDEQPKPASAGVKRADIKTCAGSSKQTSLQKRLGITKKEAEKLRGDKRTTAQGYSNLVGNPESCSGGGGGGGSSRSSSAEGLSAGPISLSPFVDFLIDRLRVTKADVKQLVLKNPGVLTMSAAGADGVSRWLKDHLGMKRREVARLLLAYPEAGQLSVEETIKPVIEWLRKTFSPKKSDLIMVLRQAPQILGQSVEGSLKPMVAFLESVMGVSSEKAANVVYILPAIFIHSAENKRDPTLAWLSEQLSSGDLSAMIDAPTKYRGMNVEKGLELSVAWLRDCEGLKREEMRRVVRRDPSTACGSSIKNRLDPILAWMKEDLGLDTNAGMAMLARCPGIIKASLNHNLKLKIPWLMKALDLTEEETVALVTRCPMLLCLSATKNLGPTIEFYLVEMGASNKDLVQEPRLLMSSLDNRLRRRVAKVIANNIKPCFSLHRHKIGRWTEDKFGEFLSTEGTTS